MGTIATLREVAEAKRFLRLIGAPINNTYMILAAVAWMRISGDSWDAGLFARRLMRRAVYTPLPLDYAHSITEAKWIAHLNEQRKARAEAYQLILAAARHGRAADFLWAIVMSDWDANHYGGYTRNRLLTIFSRFTGLQNPPPKQTTTPKPKPRQMPKAPTVLQPPTLADAYTDGFRAGSFYKARNRGRKIETLDTVALGEVD